MSSVVMDVEVRQSRIDGAGRGLFAKKDFAPGDIVLQLERPYVAELDVARMHDVCAWCFRRGPDTDEEHDRKADFAFMTGNDIELKACTGCKRVRYCSKTCQSKAWKREHKYECKVIGVPGRPDLPHGVRAVIKLLGKLKNDPQGKDERLLDILQFVPAGGQDPDKQLEKMSKDNFPRFEDFDTLAYGAWKYSGEHKLDGMDSLAVAKGFFFNVMSNTISLSTPMDDVSLGVGFDPLLCSANHSCEPNAVTMFNQPRQVLRARKQIKAGDEIFIKYCDITNPFSVRQTELRTEFGFTCKCAKCRKGALFAEDKFLKSPEQLSSDLAKVADNLVKRHEKRLPMFYTPVHDETAQRRGAALQAEAFSVSGLTQDVNKGNETASEGEVLDTLKLCLNSGLWSYTRQPVPHLIRQLIIIYLAQDRIYQVWRLGILREFLINPILFPEPFYPDRVVDCWTTAVATNSLCDPHNPAHKEIFDQCMQAGFDLRVVYLGLLLTTRENIEKSYGRDSPFGRVVESVYQQTLSNMDISLEKIKEKIKETWPKLEAIARNVDVLKL